MPFERLTRPIAPVPFYDLRPSHAEVKRAILAEVDALIDEGAFTNGRQVGLFEQAFASAAGAAHCVGVASGLDALRLALLACGLERGDDVLVPAMTFVATLEAVTQAGGTPVVVDVSEADYGLDASRLRSAAGPRARFVVPVHLYGQVADMAAIGRAAEGSDLVVIEDACQAHGAWRDGVPAGTSGAAAAFSFYPAKNLGAFGDAGALITDDETIATRVRALREHGQIEKYHHDIEGWTARLDTLQAVVLLHKLPLLERWNDERRALVALYDDALEGVGDLRLPPVPPSSRPSWHLYVVRTADPGALAEHLAGHGIRTGRHYPEPVHLSQAYAWLGHARGDFPVAEALAREALSLPLFPGMSERQVEDVVRGIGEYFAGA